MGILVLLLVLAVGLMAALRAGRALQARIGPVVAGAGEPATTVGFAPADPPVALTSGTFEEYVRGGLVDLRIMLVQAARRRHQ
ncbi:MAG: hypothetical protein ACTHKG_12245 [Nocardioides sp.]